MLDHSSLEAIGFEVHALGKARTATKHSGDQDFVLRASSSVFDDKLGAYPSG